MPTRYLEILSQHAPFPLPSLDTNGRTMFSCNFVAVAAAPVLDFKNEIMAVIATAGLGTRGTDIFVGRHAKMPIGDGPYILFMETAGFPPLETHDDALYERRGFQLVVLGTVYSATEARANALWRALDGVRNTEVTGLP